ncbi:MAG: hypothetical protein ACREV6_09710 [Clostridium sp.]|uniref:hypothetical protein n=1 Tax=Clostridium sp. TaxID=1506 RepID=UPI003D6CE54A
MKKLIVLYSICKADFLERTRRYSFLITMFITVYVAFYVIPTPDKYGKTLTLHLGVYRGIYNSAWIGICETLVAVTFLSLFGFYIVKGTIERDKATGVGQIIATTPISKFDYMFGKFLSNFIFLSFMAFIIGIVALIMQFIRAEDMKINLWNLYSPFLMIVLPMMALVAALALLFENIKFLRGGFGNIVYFFLWTGFIVTSIAVKGKSNVFIGAFSDICGVNIAGSSFKKALSGFSDYNGDLVIGTSPELANKALKVFHYNGINWTSEYIIEKIILILFAVILVFVASLLFKRFDSYVEKVTKIKKASRTEKEKGYDKKSFIAIPASKLTRPNHKYSFINVLKNELKLMLKGIKWWGYIVVLGVIIASVASRGNDANKIILSISMILPILIWSKMGTMENRFGTNQLVFTCENIIKAQFLAVYLSGVVVAVLINSGFFIKFVVTGNFSGVLCLISACVFVPAMAFALGSVTGGSKIFEVIYLLMWYMEPLNDMPYLDYIGVTKYAVNLGIPYVYGAVGILLLGVALIARKRRMVI